MKHYLITDLSFQIYKKKQYDYQRGIHHDDGEREFLSVEVDPDEYEEPDPALQPDRTPDLDLKIISLQNQLDEKTLRLAEAQSGLLAAQRVSPDAEKSKATIKTLRAKIDEQSELIAKLSAALRAAPPPGSR